MIWLYWFNWSFIHSNNFNQYTICRAQLAGAVEYTDCFAPPTSDGEVLVSLELWTMRSTHSLAIAPRSTLARAGSTW